jgi:hypothetical protein
MYKKYMGFILAGALLAAACEKNELKTPAVQPVTDKAQVKVIFFSAYKANPLYQININDARVSNALGGTSNPSPFPGGGLNTGGGSSADYLALTPGSNKVSIAIPKIGTNTDSVPLASTTVSLESGKKYSLYFTDTAANATSLLVEDSLKIPDSGFARYKFINLMPNQPALDLYIGTTKVASNIGYKQVSPSFVLPTNLTGFTWAIKKAGDAANVGTYAGAASSVANQRVFSVIARGYSGIPTTDFRKPTVSLTYNQ